LVADRSGNIWFTANFEGYIGKLDPGTGGITEYWLADRNATDPHTPVFDQSGTLWFTVESADMVGRLNPQSGQVTLLHVPTPGAEPYGMAVNALGIPFFAEFGTNKLASIDPQTLVIQEYTLPNPATRPRRIAICKGWGDLVHGLCPRHGRSLRPAGRSPGGPDSGPYGIALAKGAVWYVETEVHPNTLVHFSPTTGRFQVWKIPSGGRVVRNMMATGEGNLVLACSGVNRVDLVTVASTPVITLPR
jgi:virginiamycin B lyase